MSCSPRGSCARRGTQRPGYGGDPQPPADPRGEQRPPAETQPEGSYGYHIIPPNEVKRSHVKNMARKEMEDLERWKEAHKPGPINLPPRKLGGLISETEAREQQQFSVQQSKYQQKLKRDEYKRKQKEEEEAEIQKMKMIQRAKAIQLEEKTRQQDQRRKQDQLLKNSELLSKLEIGTPYNNFYQNRFGQESNALGRESNTREWESSVSSQDLNAWGRDSNLWEQDPRASDQESNAWSKSHVYAQNRKDEEQKRLQQMKDEQQRKSELLELKRKKAEQEQTKNHRRVNNAFLDRLGSANHPDGTYQTDHYLNAHNPFGYSYSPAKR